MGRAELLFLLRLCVALVAVGLLVHWGRPLLGPLLARGARDLVLLTSFVPHLAGLWFQDGLFRVTTRLAVGQATLEPGPYWFVVGFPVAFAAALPGLRSRAWWLRLLGVALLSVAAASVLLAITADGQLVRGLWSSGLRVNPRWRDALVRVTMARFWELAALIYPFAVCAWLAWVGLLRRSPEGASAPGDGRSGRWLAVASGVLLLGAVAADRLAEWRLARAPEVLYARLEAYNPDLGLFLLRQARRQEIAGRTQEALRSYSLAARYPAQRRLAERGMARMQALERARQAQ